MTQEPTILFDGTCNLCNGCVHFLLRHDKQKRFRFAALQSDAGQQALSAIATADEVGEEADSPAGRMVETGSTRVGVPPPELPPHAASISARPARVTQYFTAMMPVVGFWPIG